MSVSERREPIRIMVDDKPIVVAKEIERACDVFIRPKEEEVKTCGYPRSDVEMNEWPLRTKNWERTLDKGDIYIAAY
jgi:hypothetical protein